MKHLSSRKKEICIALFLFFIFRIANAQVCVPNSQYTQPGIYPDSATGLNYASYNVLYNQVITFIIPQDTIAYINGTAYTVTIDSVKIKNWNNNIDMNLPPNFATSCEPTGCVFPGGSTGCMLITGMTTAIYDTGKYDLFFDLVYYISNIPLVGTYIQDDGSEDISYYYIDVFPHGMNIISGKVFNDSNSNCNYDTIENNLINTAIKISPINKYAFTNISGNYSILVDTGIYNLEVIFPYNYWQQTCPSNPPTYTVSFTNYYDTSATNNFANEIAIYCPLMTVDISTWALRACMQSFYTVQYCNNGTTIADSAYIEVAFDNALTPVSSTLPWSAQNGNVYTFNIGTVAPQQCGSFFITVNVSCVAVLGSTHCVEAHIYPDSICTPVDSTWDHSSISVEGICVNDSLACFTILNSGADMQGASQWRIYENNALVDTGYFQLAAGDSIVLCHPAQGLTIRLEADQRPGHPGNSHPQANVELCNGVPPAASTGFITQVPEDDADEFIETDCRQITAAVDPNEKQVKPNGILQNHFIDSTALLEYQINFQNTGTDTAFRIVVRDTLTQNLDITTVQSGAASHPYTFRIYGTGILEWTFNPILLPDSNANEALSHGFIRFKAKQKPGNPIGTVIQNRAAIYFDYNTPVLTNTTFNTVWQEPPLSVSKIYEENTGILVYPNPFSESTMVQITNHYRFTDYKLSIYNLLGEAIKNYQLTTNNYQLKRSDLPAGIYIYKVFSSEKMIGAGKLVVE